MIPLEIRVANFLDTVSFVADKARQKAVWVDHDTRVSSVISVGELYSQFFDDNDIDNFIADELDAAPLKAEQKNAIRAFRDALDGFSKAHKSVSASDADLIEDPEWDKLVRLAEVTLAAF